MKLLASALDRASTVVLGGAVLGPLFQSHFPQWIAAPWLAGTVVLHLLGQLVLGFIREE